MMSMYLVPIIFSCLLATCLVMFVYVARSLKSAVLFEKPRGAVGPSPGALVIVEPRRHPMLAEVIRAFSARVPSDWVLYVVHGRSNASYAQSASQTPEKRPTVFIELNADNLTAAQYNALFKTPAFWEAIQAEHILVFQTDSMPCTTDTLDLKRFGKFGYIGCAYNGDLVGPNTYWEDGYGFYGVGGLSLRRKSFMMKCLKQHPVGSKPEAEDVTFGACVDSIPGFAKPSAIDIGDFCAQGSWGDTSRQPRSWGVHKFNEGGMSASTKKTFKEYCPVASMT